jgi:hypothetical protein
MAGRLFMPASWPGGTAPAILGYNPDAAPGLITTGSLVVIVAGGGIQLCGADPALVLGVALEPVSTNPGFQNPFENQTTVITGRSAKIPVALASGVTIFTCDGTRAPLQSDIGINYGVVNTAGVWQIDLTDTTADVVQVVDVDLALGFYYVKFVVDVAQIPAST